MADDVTSRDSGSESEQSCVFCQIVRAELPATIVHSDEEVIVVNDLNPKAPIHMLVIPKKHLSSLSDMTREDIFPMGHMIWVAKMMADEQRIDTKGYKLVFNVGTDGGQTVPHVHLHLLGGQSLREVPV